MRDNFENCLLVTDLDGTFFGAGATVIQRNIDALERFTRLGGRFTMATGRIHVNALRSFPQAKILCNAPGIMANGSYLYDFATGERLCENTMDPALCCQVIRFAHEVEPSVGARVSTGDGFAADPRWSNEAIRRDLVEYKGSSLIFEPIETWDLTALRCFKVVFRGEAEVLLRLRRVMEDRFGGQFEFCTSSPHFFEMQTVGCSKGAALLRLKALLEERNGHKFEAWAIGDYENDLPMLKVADRSACPENAMEAVKAVVDDQVCHCNEGALADWLERL